MKLSKIMTFLIPNQHSADKLLAEKALARFNAPNAGFGEKTFLGIAAAMKVKRKLEIGLKKRRKPIKKRGESHYRKLYQKLEKELWENNLKV